MRFFNAIFATLTTGLVAAALALTAASFADGLTVPADTPTPLAAARAPVANG